MNSLIIRNKIVEENMGLVYMVAKKFCGRGVEFEDIVQIGSVGLIKAGERFNPELNVKFSTYAVTVIMGEIKRYFRDDGLVKIPRTIKESGVKIVKAIEELKKTLNREPTVFELSNHLNLDSEKIVEALNALKPCESIFADSENDVNLCEKIPDIKDGNIEIEDEIFLKEILNTLDTRLRRIVILRFFRDKSQSEVGKMLGISQVQVSRLEKKALQILKNQSKLST